LNKNPSLTNPGEREKPQHVKMTSRKILLEGQMGLEVFVTSIFGYTEHLQIYCVPIILLMAENDEEVDSIICFDVM